MKRTLLPSLALALLSLTSAGCGILLGNVRPVDEKSESYGILDLSQDNKDWQKLDPADSNEGSTREETELKPTEISDVAYQSKKTASIISLNSACRPNQEKQDLREATSLLLLGINDVTLREEKGLKVQKYPGLETTIQGRLNNEDMKLRTVVIQRENCIFDLMYIARPHHFEEQTQAFSKFVSSLRLK